MERGSPFQDEAGAWVVTRYDDAAALLADPRYVVPPATGDGERGPLAWLRRTVCRFSEGPAHARRRAVAEAELAGMEPAELRTAAHDLTARILDTGVTDPSAVDPAVADPLGTDPLGTDPLGTDAVAAIARRVPVEVLGRAMGVRDGDALAAAVPPVAAVYLTGADRPETREAADDAVGVLVGLLGPGTDEWVANRIALLAQAYEATAGLIERAVNALDAKPDAGRWSAEAILEETVRWDPPVPALRRVASADLMLGGCAVAAGVAILVDVRAVNGDPDGVGAVTFGVGRRPCPGVEQAMALASGVVEALARRRTGGRGKTDRHGKREISA